MKKAQSWPLLSMLGLAGSHQLGGLIPPSLQAPGREGWRGPSLGISADHLHGTHAEGRPALSSLLQGHSPLRTFRSFQALGSLSTTDLQLSSGAKDWACIWHSLSLDFSFEGATGHPSKNRRKRVSKEGRWRERLAGGCPSL